MLALITLLCYFCHLIPYGFVNRIFYAFDRRFCTLINRYLSHGNARRIFALLSTYLDFHFAGNKKLIAALPPQYLVMSNHQSLLDIPLFMRFLDGPRLRFVAKAELGRHVPVVSVMLRSGGHCLLKRSGSAAQAMQALDSFAERVVANNWIPVIFPEGTRSRDGKLGTFHAAGFRRFLDRAPMPVAVCALDGAWRISSLFGLRKNIRGTEYRVTVLKVYPAPTSKAEQVRILEEGKALIQEQLEAWNAKKKRAH